MATQFRDHGLERDLETVRRWGERKRYALIGFIGLVALATAGVELSNASAGVVPAISRLMVAVLGLVSAAALYLRPALGWRLAMAWAVLQVPFLALSPDGDFTSQAIRIPVTFFRSRTFDGEMLSSYTAIGFNVVGTIMAAWLRGSRDLFE